MNIWTDTQRRELKISKSYLLLFNREGIILYSSVSAAKRAHDAKTRADYVILYGHVNLFTSQLYLNARSIRYNRKEMKN